MATELSHPIESIAPAENELDEASISASLSRLQEMHAALRNLRETIPHVMNFDLVEPSAPEQLHLHFAQVARGAAMDIKKFAHIMEDSNSKEVLEKARESYSRSGDDMRNWLVTEHADWLDVKGDNEDDGVKLEEKEVEVKKSVLQEDAEDVKSILEAFKEAHPNLDISMDEASGETKLHLRPPAQIHFTIHSPPFGQNQTKPAVSTSEKTKFHKSILDAIAARPKQEHKLANLLEMLASYAEIKTKPCSSCTRLLDRNAQFPIRRARKRVRQADGKIANQWEALHAACS